MYSFCPGCVRSSRYRTRPEPETLAQVTCGHGSPDEALHSHDVEPVTSTLAAPPRAGRFIVAAESVNPLHPAAGWVMITVCPLIVIVPVRDSIVLFGEAVNESELVPNPNYWTAGASLRSWMRTSHNSKSH